MENAQNTQNTPNSGLACTGCRQRKVHCTRTLPECDRCVSKHIPCVYPDRRPRKKKAREPPIQRIDRDISAILDRLQRIERHAPASDSLGVISTPSTPWEPSEDVYSSDSTGPWSADLANASDPRIPQKDVTSSLKDALRLVENRRQRRNMTKLAIRQAIDIPPSAARVWIQDYFSYAWGVARSFSKLVDRKLIEMIPDLESMDGVHVDANMMLIYYCILWYGSSYCSSSTDEHDRSHAEHIFSCCMRIIPLWQNEVTGSVRDFIAALFITETAMENLHFGLSWEMHKRACDYAQRLGLHNIDGSEAQQGHATEQDRKEIDDLDRMGLWDLIQLDLFYRLISNKPSAFSISLNEWRVNMPWLLERQPPGGDEAVPVMAFLTRSRFTIILAEYFQCVESLPEEADFLSVVEPFCTQMESVFSEWQIKEWLQSYENNRFFAWILTDLTLSGYTCVLFMHRRPRASNNNREIGETVRTMGRHSEDTIARTDASLRAARGALQTTMFFLELIGSFMCVETVSWALGVYQIHVAYAHLAEALMEDAPRWAYKDDMMLLKSFVSYMENMSRIEADFSPLTQALINVYGEVEREDLPLTGTNTVEDSC